MVRMTTLNPAEGHELDVTLNRHGTAVHAEQRLAEKRAEFFKTHPAGKYHELPNEKRESEEEK